MTQLGTSEPSLRRSEKPGTPLNPPDVDESRAPAIIENGPSMLHSSVLPLTPDEGVDHASLLLPKSSTTSHLAPTNVEEVEPDISKVHPSPLLKASSHLLPADIVFADYLLRSNRPMVLSASSVQPRWQDWTWAQLRLPQFQALDHDSHNDELFRQNDAAITFSLLAHS
jgi:hypothetical protein